MTLPAFICIGAQKSGTTWLYEQLRRNPAVHLPAKEINYFFKDLPLDWYRERLAGAQPGQIVGDISPVYGVDPRIAGRIAATVPDAKLILLIRDPVERAWSQFKMATKLGNIARGTPFLEAFFENRQYMQRRGRYAEIINDFGGPGVVGKTMLVVDFDDIAAHPAEVIKTVSGFLGVEPRVDEAIIKSKFAVNRNPEPIASGDAEQVAAYYREPNRQLAAMLPSRPAWL